MLEPEIVGRDLESGSHSSTVSEVSLGNPISSHTISVHSKTK